MLDALEKGQKVEGYSPFGTDPVPDETNPPPDEMSPASDETSPASGEMGLASGEMNRFNGALIAWAPRLSKRAHAPVRSLPHEGRKMKIKRKS
jgi:hypothetical protein